jgi:hypothetical protein
MPSEAELTVAFHELYDVQGGCWVWRAGLNSQGFAIFQGTLAYRWAVVHLQHRTIPPHERWVNRCTNKRCVNPDHWEGRVAREVRHLAEENNTPPQAELRVVYDAVNARARALGLRLDWRLPWVRMHQSGAMENPDLWRVLAELSPEPETRPAWRFWRIAMAYPPEVEAEHRRFWAAHPRTAAGQMPHTQE